MKEKWNERYHTEGFVYGEEPNQFFQEYLVGLPPGKILLPADGEGRNGVYAATLGWQVDSFDQSEQAQKKALLLAERKGVAIRYKVMDFSEVTTTYHAGNFDVIALIFSHLPFSLKEEYFQKLPALLRSGGYLILEGFSKNHVHCQQNDHRVGGPADIDMLYSEDEIRRLFHQLNIIRLTEEEVCLSEGYGHNGVSSVIRFLGQKI